MEIELFGQALVETGDLDPVYIAIVNAKLDDQQLSKLLVAYWCFYHLGVAAWMSEQDEYWDAMLVAAANLELSPLGSRWPRGAERRHFRGAKCVSSILWLSRYSACTRVDYLAHAGSVAEVAWLMAEWPLFGPWIAYKAADMLERCYGASIHFPEDLCYIYKEPRAALDLLAPQAPEVEMERLLSVFSRLRAPPCWDRPCGPQEVETILCKWKSSQNGHYWVGKDIHEIRHGLKGWGATAGQLLNGCPKEVRRDGELF